MKSTKKILFDNFFTLFNFLNLFLGIAVFLVGSYKNMLFLGVVILNTAISTFQELHSKKVLEQLSVLAETKAKVIRDSKVLKIPISELVLNDVVELNTGNQVVADSVILEGEVQVNESFITGESDAVFKKKGDTILSGSFIDSGKCTSKIIHIGEDNYVEKISSSAKYVKKLNSEIMKSLKKIIKFLTFAIIPIGIALFSSQLNLEGMAFRDAVVQTVAAMIGMIPEGLVLLTSTVLAVSVIRLSKSKVLVQELYCIETLARVDTLCLDKTGTLTEGIMEVKNYVPLGIDKKEMKNILANIAKFSEDENSTINAIRNKFKKVQTEFVPKHKVAFSSKQKWSGINFENEGSYIIGAPEFVVPNSSHNELINKYASDYRVVVLAHSKNNFDKNSLPENIEVVGLILILDKIRQEAPKTLKYFYNQGVDVKIISGDNPLTVTKVAKQAGIKNYKKYIDMSKVKDEEIENIVLDYTIFGRVSPTQKELLVLAMQKKGRTVAMTGDGVNDVLALKASDCSVAMANGSDATKRVSQIVLLDSNFASMPKVVAEGRRTINNIQRSASLFLVKTIYSTILAIMFLILREQYPFEPIQLSLISVITIGIPSFILALEPNNERIKGDFLKNIISRALPTGMAVSINIFAVTYLQKHSFIDSHQASTLCVIGTGLCGILLLFTLAKTRKSENSKLPFSVFRLTLAIVLALLFTTGIIVFDGIFSIAPLTPMLGNVLALAYISAMNFVVLTLLFKLIIFNKRDK